MNTTPLVTIGIVTYNSQRYLSGLLPSLSRQTYSNIELRFFDNASSDATCAVIQELSPKAHLHQNTQNSGFGSGHNALIKEAKGEYYFCLNPDIILEDHCIETLVEALQNRPELGAVGPKTYRLHPHTLTPTEQVDTAGMSINTAHKVWEEGMGEADRLEWQHSREVFGVSGSALLAPVAALKAIADSDGNVFDPAIFLYKEDVDLCYRLQLANYPILFVPQAIAYHVRSTPPSRWRYFFRKSPQVIQWSASHHIRVVLKNMPLSMPRFVTLPTYLRLWVICAYLCCYSPALAWKSALLILGLSPLPKTPLRTDLPRLLHLLQK